MKISECKSIRCSHLVYHINGKTGEKWKCIHPQKFYFKSLNLEESKNISEITECPFLKERLENGNKRGIDWEKGEKNVVMWLTETNGGKMMIEKRYVCDFCGKEHKDRDETLYLETSRYDAELLIGYKGKYKLCLPKGTCALIFCDIDCLTKYIKKIGGSND